MPSPNDNPTSPDTPIFKNLEYLGQCYDLTRVNPLDPSDKHRNGGGAYPHHAIPIDQSLALVLAPGQGVRVPQGTQYEPESRAHQVTRASTWFTSEDMRRTFERTVSTGISAGKKLASFSASQTVQEFEKRVSKQETVETFVQSFFEVCVLRFHPDHLQKARLGASIEAALRALTTKADCEAFIQKYGTHYAYEIVMGGSMYQRSRMSSATYKTLKGQVRDVGLAMEAHFKKTTRAGAGKGRGRKSKNTGPGFNVSYNSSEEEISKLKNNKGVHFDELNWCGGTPNPDWSVWTGTVRDDPKPIQLGLKPLYDLFDVPGMAGVQTKKALLKTAIDAYIDENKPLAPDLSRLANHDFDIRQASVRPGSSSPAEFGYKDIELPSGHPSKRNFKFVLGLLTNHAIGVPEYIWRLIPVAGTDDQFYIKSRLKQGTGDPSDSTEKNRYGGVWGFDDDAGVRLRPANRTDLHIPWQFIPVAGKTDEFTLRCRLAPDKGGPYLDWMLAVDEEKDFHDKMIPFLKLVPEGDSLEPLYIRLHANPETKGRFFAYETD
jgi:hypothetical protein